MLKAGVPEAAVRHKMVGDGLGDKEQTMIFGGVAVVESAAAPVSKTVAPLPMDQLPENIVKYSVCTSIPCCDVYS